MAPITFLDLPPEIRYMIYDLALVSDRLITLPSDFDRNCPSKAYAAHPVSRPSRPNPPETEGQALLLTEYTSLGVRSPLSYRCKRSSRFQRRRS